jgi:2-methylisocitrate lyase-like PEP mutase family enzyme
MTPVAPKVASQKTTAQLRELMAKPGVIDCPSIYDPISARIAESLGFKCVSLEGSALGIAVCQVEAALSLEDFAKAVRGITAVINIPLIVDAGGGFGEPAHVFNTIRVLEHAGAAGVHIEDQIFPKRFHYFFDSRVDVIPAEIMIDKIQCAVEARRDPDFVIIGRTDTVKTHDINEAIRRANLYCDAGADMLMLFPNTVEEAKRAAKETRAPLNYVNAEHGESRRPNFSAAELEAMGYKVLYHPSGAILLACKAVKDAFVELKETGHIKMDPKIFASFRQEIYGLMGLPNYYRIEKETNCLGSASSNGDKA